MNKIIKLTLIALAIFGAANLQSAEANSDFDTQTAQVDSHTERLHAAIDDLNVEAVQEILRAHPEEANKSSQKSSPLLHICYKFSTSTSQSDIESLNQITIELLRAGADPTKKAVPVSMIQLIEFIQNLKPEIVDRSPLTDTSTPLHEAIQIDCFDFLQTVLSYQYSTPLNLKQFDNTEDSLLYAAISKATLSKKELLDSSITTNFITRRLETIKLLLLAGADYKFDRSWIDTKIVKLVEIFAGLTMGDFLSDISKQEGLNRLIMKQFIGIHLVGKKIIPLITSQLFTLKISLLKLLNERLIDSWNLFRFDNSIALKKDMFLFIKNILFINIIQLMLEVSNTNKNQDEYSQALDQAMNKGGYLFLKKINTTSDSYSDEDMQEEITVPVELFKQIKLVAESNKEDTIYKLAALIALIPISIPVILKATALLHPQIRSSL